MRAAWRALGLRELPVRAELAANTLSALYLPDGAGPSLVARIGDQGVQVAGGLLPELKERYFRVGHMGYATTRPEMLRRTVAAVADALAAESLPVARDAALAALG
jgi:alanine-glyoxylate transaminase/serine-glyoxylate transaminase/serine-pyruvate transaminase